MFLGGFELTPSYKDVANKFSVSYILNLVLVDEDDRRYFKQREIILYRKTDKKLKSGKLHSHAKALEQYERTTNTPASTTPSSDSLATKDESKE